MVAFWKAVAPNAAPPPAPATGTAAITKQRAGRTGKPVSK
jgi:hypothetical protein